MREEKTPNLRHNEQNGAMRGQGRLFNLISKSIGLPVSACIYTGGDVVMQLRGMFRP